MSWASRASARIDTVKPALYPTKKPDSIDRNQTKSGNLNYAHLINESDNKEVH